jgi:hypothetical protein
MAIPEKYKSDHLLLLVGGNPLPNAIAARLLVKPDATISLLHSEMSKEVAQRLQAWLLNTSGLGLNQNKVRLVPVDETDPQSIAKKVQEEIQKIKGSSVGLHYTGGTKIMVAHAYRMALKEKQKSVCFSYLDARQLQMIFDPENPLNERPYIEPVGLDAQAKMSDEPARSTGSARLDLQGKSTTEARTYFACQRQSFSRGIW